MRVWAGLRSLDCPVSHTRELNAGTARTSCSTRRTRQASSSVASVCAIPRGSRRVGAVLSFVAGGCCSAVGVAKRSEERITRQTGGGRRASRAAGSAPLFVARPPGASARVRRPILDRSASCASPLLVDQPHLLTHTRMEELSQSGDVSNRDMEHGRRAICLSSLQHNCVRSRMLLAMSVESASTRMSDLMHLAVWCRRTTWPSQLAPAPLALAHLLRRAPRPTFRSSSR